MNEIGLAQLRDLLARGEISQAAFDVLAGKAGRSAVVQGPNYGNMNTGEQHFHFPQPAAPGSAPEELLRAYLLRVWKQFDAPALLAGSDARHPVRLGAIYTALMTEVPNRQLHDDAHSKLSAVAMLDRESRLVILGGPGSGKTTFVGYVAQAMAGELLGGAAPAPQPNLAALTAPLAPPEGEARAEAASTEPQPWQHGALLPVVVVLRDLAAQLPRAGERVGADHVWDYLASELQSASLADARAALQAHLRETGGLVMFDGLDEVPDARNRRTQIKQVVEDFATTHARCRVLVTSRTYAYQKQDWKLKGFEQALLAPFTPRQVAAFVHAWYLHMVELVRLTAADAQARAQALLRQAEQNPRVAELARRPLLLTLFARLQTEQGSALPEKREELYHASVKMLLNDWERMKPGRTSGAEPEPSLTEWLKASHDDVRRELDRLAFEAHRDQADLQGTASIRQADLVAALLRASPDPQLNPRLLETYLRDRAGILVEHGVGVLQFPHRTFQEYLAACHLANDDYPGQLAGLLRADPPRWREVTLLAAAHAARGNAEHPTWLLAEELCPAVPDAAAVEGDAWAALLAAEVVVTAGQHLTPRRANRPKLETVRGAQLALLRGPWLPARERASAGLLLARIGDPRTEVTTLDGMHFCWVPAGPFTMGSEEHEDERPPHRVDLPYGYAIGRYPVTVVQWHDYLARSGRSDDDSTEGYANDPVTGVSWYQAQEFCAFLTTAWSARLPAGWRACLPSEAEWEKAARGGHRLAAGTGPPSPASTVEDTAFGAVLPRRAVHNPWPARRWPWGDQFDGEMANTLESGTTRVSSVGAFPRGRSPYGCEEMAGNVWEWTRSLWGENYDKPLFRYPYEPADAGRENEGAGKSMFRLVRGGSYSSLSGSARCARRYRFHPDGRDDLIGLRVVLRSAPVL